MSRIGIKPVAIPSGVKVNVAGDTVTIEGKLGKLEMSSDASIEIEQSDDSNALQVKRKGDDRHSRAMHGLTRSLLQNMVVGVTEGYVIKLEVHGVGYWAEVKGPELHLRVGYHDVKVVKIPEGVQVEAAQEVAGTDRIYLVTVSGCDKQKVGQFAAQARAVRKPEPYKGKGIRYRGEQIRRKAGKAVVK